jgi:hypothetical protein
MDLPCKGHRVRHLIGAVENTGTIVRQWEVRAEGLLVGRTSVAVRYMNQPECEATMWDRSALVRRLDNGLEVFRAAGAVGHDRSTCVMAKR